MRIVDPAAPSPLVVAHRATSRARCDYAPRRDRPTRPRSGSRPMARTSRCASTRPADGLPAIVASPTFGVVPPGVGSDPAALLPRVRRQRRLRRSRRRPTTSHARGATSTTGPARRRSRRSSSSTTSAAAALSRRSRPATSTTPSISPLRRDLDRLRRDLGPQLRAGCLAVAELLRLRHDAGRRSTTSASARPSPWRRLAAARRARRRPAPQQSRRAWSRRASRVGATTRLPARSTTRRPPGRCLPRRAIPGGAGFPAIDVH